MAKIELTEEINQEWENSLNTDFLTNNKELVNQLYVFLRQYDTGDESKRVEFINNTINVFAEAMNVKIRKIKVVNNPAGRSAGSYLASEKQVNINIASRTGSYIFSAQILTTILHELRHAYQDQHLMKVNSDFGRLIKHDTENYTQPSDNNMMQEIGYITNFIEVDAQRFSHRAAKSLVEEVIKNAQNEGRIVRRILEVKLRDVIYQEKAFESSYGESIKILNNSDSIVQHIKEHFIKTCIAFYESNFETREEEILSADLISDSMEQFVNIRENKTIIRPEISDILDLYMTTLSSVDPKELAGKLNNSVTAMFNKIGYNLRFYSNLNKKKDNHLISYNSYLSKLREGVEFGKIFLDKFEIPYNNNSTSDIYEKYSENVFDYLSQVFTKSENEEFDKMLAENILSLELRDPKRFGREKLISKIYEQYSTDEIKKILEESVDNNSNIILKTFPIDKNLLKGYASKYIMEKNNGAFSRFLDFYKIQYSKNNFSDIFDKYNENYPKFFAECLSKDDLSEFEEEFLSYAFSFSTNDSVENNAYIEAIEKMYSKNKIKDILECENRPHHAVDYLLRKDITLNDFHKENPEKEVSFGFSE